MRSTDILALVTQHTSTNDNARKMTYYASQATFKGGWESWLQAELAYAISTYTTRDVIREEPYRNANNHLLSYTNNGVRIAHDTRCAARCDLYAYRNDKIKGKTDELYLELKCFSPYTDKSYQDAWNRFNKSITKMMALRPSLRNDVHCVAMLALWGLKPEDRNKSDSTITHVLNIRYCDSNPQAKVTCKQSNYIGYTTIQTKGNTKCTISHKSSSLANAVPSNDGLYFICYYIDP